MSRPSPSELLAMTIGRRRFIRLVGAGGAALTVGPALAARVGASSAGRPIAAQRSGTVTVGVWQEPSVLNPHLVGTGTGSGYYVHPILEGLAQFDASGQLVPKLAESIPSVENGGVSADGLTVTYKLKQNVKWSDGQPFTADDVVYTYQYLADEQIPTVSGGKYRAALKSVEAVDPSTVRLTFAQLYAAWPLLFNGVDIILPKHVVGASPNPAQSDFNRQPVGTGPFKVASYTAGDQIRYVPNEQYRDPSKPLLSELILKFVPNVEALVEAVKSGQLDVAWNVKESDREGLVGQPNLTLVEGPISAAEQLIFNLTDPKNPEAPGSTHPVLGDVRVRQAIELAIDKQAIIDQLLGGVTTVATTVFSRPEWAAPTIAPAPFDPERAKALLEEAGWTVGSGNVREKDGVRAALEYMTTSGDKLREQTQLVIRQYLADVGIEVNINDVPASIFFGLGDKSGPPNKGNFDIAMFTNGPDPDPQAYMTSWSCDSVPRQENNYGGNFNWSRYCDPEYDARLAAAAATLDQTERKAIYQQMADLLDRAKINVFLFNRLAVHAQTAKVAGLAFNPWTDLTWNAEDWTVTG